MPDALILGNSSGGCRRIIPAPCRLDAVGHAHVATVRSRFRPDPERMITLVFESYDAALANVSTMNSAHHEWAGRALASGRRIVVDKPAGISPAEVEEKVELAGKSGLTIAKATVYPLDPLTDPIRKTIAWN